MNLRYKLSEEQQHRLGQFARTNYAEFFVELLLERQKRINEMFRSVVPEVFQQVQGRALEIDDLIVLLKAKESTGE